MSGDIGEAFVENIYGTKEIARYFNRESPEVNSAHCSYI